MSSRKLSRGQRLGAVAVAVLGLATGCNFVLGGASLAAAGGIGYLSWQCYDHVAISVRDMSTGSYTCDAALRLSSLDDPDVGWSLQPCYHAALTPGRWRLTASLPGSEETSTELTISRRSGACPHYTHTVEMSVWPAGTPRAAAPRLRVRQVAPPVSSPVPATTAQPPLSSPAVRAFEIAPAAPKPSP